MNRFLSYYVDKKKEKGWAQRNNIYLIDLAAEIVESRDHLSYISGGQVTFKK